MGRLAAKGSMSGVQKVFSVDARTSSRVDVIRGTATAVVLVKCTLVVERTQGLSGDAIVLAAILIMNLIDMIVVVGCRIIAKAVLVVDSNRVLTGTVESIRVLVELTLVSSQCRQANSFLPK